MRSHTFGTITLHPTSNDKCGHYFLILSTWSCLNQLHTTTPPMPRDVIDRVHSLYFCNPKCLCFGKWNNVPYHLYDNYTDVSDTESLTISMDTYPDYYYSSNNIPVNISISNPHQITWVRNNKNISSEDIDDEHTTNFDTTTNLSDGSTSDDIEDNNKRKFSWW